MGGAALMKATPPGLFHMEESANPECEVSLMFGLLANEIEV